MRTLSYDSKSGHAVNSVHFTVQWKELLAHCPHFKLNCCLFVCVFVNELEGCFNCCVLSAGKNTHSDVVMCTHDGFDVVGAQWVVEEQRERKIVLKRGERMEKSERGHDGEEKMHNSNTDFSILLDRVKTNQCFLVPCWHLCIT